MALPVLLHLALWLRPVQDRSRREVYELAAEPIRLQGPRTCGKGVERVVSAKPGRGTWDLLVCSPRLLVLEDQLIRWPPPAARVAAGSSKTGGVAAASNCLN
ncbi:hypothetical protein CISG_08493 [Coccidioides immitis RMSCC 3703]|uniref:Secreted protein n=2 Tax=Coccidioides immitis TaxID=5501 RepID=A0A0J8R9V5_COCIT|nr:hypothetical protein CIRG_06204 [Coccidioides immitis RMSCC 2394]KMU80583.1 hypothetical protein CISG_08493 [Coccidioides immitis RMSCC 3703]